MEGIKILVLDRGFVLLARIMPHPTLAFHWRCEPARTIRVWGTTQGLTELVNGPTDKTVLDPPANESHPFRAVLRIIDVEEKSWKKYL